jgi:KUP system potassium uptake protein
VAWLGLGSLLGMILPVPIVNLQLAEGQVRQAAACVLPNTTLADAGDIADGLWHVNVRFGFVEIPNLALALTRARDQGCPVDLDDAIYFAARDQVVPSKTRPRLPAWQRMLFGFMYHNAVRTPDRFDLPSDKFVEVSRQVEL